MKEVIGNLERILELTATHGICINETDNATNETQLDYVESKIRFNAIQALNAFDGAHIEKEKPKRTRVEYELLCNTNFNVWGLKELLDNGDLFYLINDEYVVVPSGSDIFSIEHFLSGNIYRRIETAIEWWEGAVAFAKKCKQVNTAVYLPEYDSIDIDGSMTRDESFDFARILLKQEGE